MTLQAEALSRTRYAHGEGVRWDEARQELLWVDIGAGRFLHAPLDCVDAPQVHEVGATAGAVTPYVHGGWLLAAGRGLVALGDDASLHPVAELERAGIRMNDAACDPQGRFWAGSMALDQRPGAGSLHRVDVDGRVTTALRGLTISNGLAWSPDGRTAYLNDSGPSITWAFDWDPEAGTLSRRRVLVRHERGYCDGLAVDDDGCLWVALWDAGAVVRVDPAGRCVARIELAARQPSDCCLVDGSLVIATASVGMRAPGSTDGLLHVADVGVSGPPVTPYGGRAPWQVP